MNEFLEKHFNFKNFIKSIISIYIYFSSYIFSLIPIYLFNLDINNIGLKTSSMSLNYLKKISGKTLM